MVSILSAVGRVYVCSDPFDSSKPVFAVMVDAATQPESIYEPVVDSVAGVGGYSQHSH